MMDLFLTNMHLFASDVNRWTGLVWIYQELSAVWTLILTAPIHCRVSNGEEVMLNFSKSVLMKKQTHLHLGWPESEQIFEWTIPLIFMETFQCTKGSLVEKKLLRILKCSLDCSLKDSLGNQKWIFYVIAMKTSFCTLYFLRMQYTRLRGICYVITSSTC